MIRISCDIHIFRNLKLPIAKKIVFGLLLLIIQIKFGNHVFWARSIKDIILKENHEKLRSR